LPSVLHPRRKHEGISYFLFDKMVARKKDTSSPVHQLDGRQSPCLQFDIFHAKLRMVCFSVSSWWAFAIPNIILLFTLFLPMLVGLKLHFLNVWLRLHVSDDWRFYFSFPSRQVLLHSLKCLRQTFCHHVHSRNQETAEGMCHCSGFLDYWSSCFRLCINPRSRRSRTCPLFDLLPQKTCKELGRTSFPFPHLHLFDVSLLQRWDESCVHQSTLVDMDAQLKSIHSWPSWWNH